MLILSLIFSTVVMAGASSTKEQLAEFKKAIKSKGERDRITALSRIAGLPGNDAAKEIRKVAARDKSERVQAAAALALARRSNPKDLKFLLGLFRSLKKRPVALAGVVDAVGEYRDPRAVEKVAEIGRKWMRKHKYPALAAIRSLGKIPARASVTHLIKLCEATYVRPGYGPARGAATAPVDSSSPGSGNVSSDTQARLSDFRPYVVASLRKLTGEVLGNDAAIWKEWWEENEDTFDFGTVSSNPNRMLRLAVTDFRYAITRPNERWQWTNTPEKGFTRTAELRSGTTLMARLSILTYNTFTRSPATTAEMVELAKKQLLDEVRELGDKEQWGEKATLDNVPAIRHTLEGRRDGGRMKLTQTMVVHRDVMYVIRLTILPGISMTDAKVAEDFVGSFKFME